MAWMLRVLTVVTLTLSFTAAGGQTAGEPKSGTPAKVYRWEDAAKEQGLGDKDLQLLRQNKFVIAGKPFRQVFQAYLGGDVPVFITSDSLLNGFHVLFEESIYRMEQAQARKLPGILEGLWKNLEKASKDFSGDSRLLGAARQRAHVILGTARNLLDANALPTDPALKALIQDEVQRVTTAKGTSRPAWLGRPDDGFLALDYARFQPRGFYTKTPTLKRYFRAVSWLQAIPFRLENDEEAAAFFLLRSAYKDPDRKREPPKGDCWTAYRAFLGAGDDWDLPHAYWLPKEITKDGLEVVRNEYRNHARNNEGLAINDQLRFLPSEPGGKTEVAFRFLSAYRIPDAVLFHRTTHPRLGKREYPSGLEVCAALGSAFARDKLAREEPKVMEEIDRSRPLFKKSSRFQQTSLYEDYLQCLAVLLQRTEPDAPPFLRGEAWTIKTCQTTLSSWVQMRHTWALQAKQGAVYLCGSHLPTGFVEPVPEFYRRLARLVDTTRDTLESTGGLANTGWDDLAQDAKSALAILDKARKDKRGLGALSKDEIALLAQFDPRLNGWGERPEKERESEKDLLDVIAEALRYCQDTKTPEARRAIAGVIGLDMEIASKWVQLSRVCHRLESLAHKQLRQGPFNEDDNDFLRSYGQQLARIMLYGGNSYISPRDDAPRVIDVFANPRAGTHLLVGTAKPRALWVLYPVKGVEVLCRGAVLPYHEFTHSERLTDADWKTLLASPRCPEQPTWTRPILTGDGSVKQRKER